MEVVPATKMVRGYRLKMTPEEHAVARDLGYVFMERTSAFFLDPAEAHIARELIERELAKQESEKQ